MVLKLHGHGMSTCTRRVATVLHEKNIPFELVEVDLRKGEHKSPSYMAHQPFGQIPYIDDDGFILYESRAICRYLAAKYADQGTPLIPTASIKETALFEQAASNEFCNFDPFASKAVFERVFKALRGLTPDQAVFDELIKGLSAKLDVYEVILGNQKYIAGNDFTLVDIFHLPYGAMLKGAGSDVMTDPARPNVLRWWTEIASRPSWVAVKDGNLAPNV